MVRFEHHGSMHLPSTNKKVLILRFSAFGDVLQALSLVGRVRSDWPDAEVHFCTRADFRNLVETHPGIAKVWCLNKSEGFAGLWKLGAELKQIPWTHIYDSHNNLRSRVLCWALNGFFQLRRLRKGHHFLRRSLYRWRRFLLFRFRINLFPQPFSGQGALLEPLVAWNLRPEPPPVPQLFFAQALGLDLPSSFIALAPSAAHPLKRWPLSYFCDLVRMMPQEKFVILGGPEDQFVEEIVRVAPDRVHNLAGKLTLVESAQVVQKAKSLVSNDTGLMHVAEQLGVRCVALMGPAPFGFPCRPSTTILERNLSCRPCSKHGQGPCVNKDVFQKCLVDILPAEVVSALQV